MAISYGSRGAAVESLQTQLNKIGAGLVVSRSGLVVDGIYGNNTEKALQAAYAQLGVPGASGVASDELLGALAAKVGPGQTVIGAKPPKSSVDVGTVTIGAAAESEGFLGSVPTPVKIGVGLVAAVIAWDLFARK